jgi:hypothetical protein
VQRNNTTFRFCPLLSTSGLAAATLNIMSLDCDSCHTCLSWSQVMQAVSNEAKAVEVAATFQTIEEAATKLDGAREEAAATMDAVAQVRLCKTAIRTAIQCRPSYATLCSGWMP